MRSLKTYSSDGKAWRKLARAGSYVVPLIFLQLADCSDQPKQEATLPSRPVLALRVASADVFAGRGLPGQARAALEATLAFRVGGRMTERRYKTGDTVKEGDVLATLDTAPYQAEVDTATANLARARAAYANAASQLERDRQLFSKDVIAKARLEGTQAAADQARAEMQSLESALERRKLDLEYTALRAPFGGVVSAVFAEAFEEVKPQQTIMRIIDPKKIEMVVNVPESMIAFIPHATAIKVAFDAFPGVEIPATLSEIGKEPSETTRTYAVKVLITPPDGVTVIPGMAGRVRARLGPEIAEQFKGVVVPLTSVFSPDDAPGASFG